MQRTFVESSTLRSAGHDAQSAALELQFHSGAVYQYGLVPRSVYRDLLELPLRAVTSTRTFAADIPTSGFNSLHPIAPESLPI
jgi:hypothetical protein